MRPLLYYITDRSQFDGDETSRQHTLLAKIREAADAGVDFIQLREKDLSGRELESLASAAVALLRDARAAGSPTKLLINSRLDVAIAAGADGIHLPSHGMSASEAKKCFREFSIVTTGSSDSPDLIGVSCHSSYEVAVASRAGASFIVFGPVFAKMHAAHVAPAGLDALHSAVAEASQVPVLALGGVTLENAHSCLQAGASGIAGIRIFQDNNVEAVIRAIRSQ